MSNYEITVLLAFTAVYLIGLTVSSWSAHRHGYKQGFRDGFEHGEMKGRGFRQIEEGHWVRERQEETNE